MSRVTVAFPPAGGASGGARDGRGRGRRRGAGGVTAGGAGVGGVGGAGSTPVPASVTVSGPLGAVSEKASEAVCAPEREGVNVTVTSQVSVASRYVAGAGVGGDLEGVPGRRLERDAVAERMLQPVRRAARRIADVRRPVPVFVTVTVWVSLVAPDGPTRSRPCCGEPCRAADGEGTGLLSEPGTRRRREHDGHVCSPKLHGRLRCRDGAAGEPDTPPSRRMRVDHGTSCRPGTPSTANVAVPKSCVPRVKSSRPGAEEREGGGYHGALRDPGRRRRRDLVVGDLTGADAAGSSASLVQVAGACINSNPPPRSHRRGPRSGHIPASASPAAGEARPPPAAGTAVADCPRRPAALERRAVAAGRAPACRRDVEGRR